MASIFNHRTNLQMDVEAPEPSAESPPSAPPPSSSSFAAQHQQTPLDALPQPNASTSNQPAAAPSATQQPQPVASSSAPTLATTGPRRVIASWPTHNLLFPHLPPPRLEEMGTSGEGTSLNPLDVVSAFLAEKGGKPLNTIEYAGVLSLIETHKQEALST